MSSELPRRRGLGLELTLVALLALAMLLPGIWSYTLVDPWETHYGEVARRMLQGDGVHEDWVHTDWQNEGFRSKPVLTFWLMAASMKALGVADHGGYSGEIATSGLTTLAIRLPFVLFGVLGLCAAWWMLARLVSRRVAWLTLFVLGTMPFYLFVARQGITDMTLVGTMIGSIAMFAVACEVGDEPVQPLLQVGRRAWTIDHRHVFVVLVGGFILAQALYYIYFFTVSPRLFGVRLGGLHPGLLIALPMLIGLALLAALELPGDELAGVRAVAYWILAIAALPFSAVRLIVLSALDRIGDAAKVPPLRTSRQVYLMWFWAFLGISVLGKGLPALGIVGIVCLFYVVLLDRWRDLLDEKFEIVRGVAIMALIAVPWHVAMFFKDGRRFLHEYFVTHLWNRAAVGVLGDRGTFDYYLSQIGYGTFIWAALVPTAIAAIVLRIRLDTSAGRARFVVAVWAVTTVAFFVLVQTKFHHYILPVIPPIAIAIAFWLDDLFAGRVRYTGLIAVVGAGIVLLIANDMMSEQKQWIEMFVYRYDRPWPSAAPWGIDVSDGFLGLGVAGALSLGVLALPRLARLGAVLLCGVAFVTAIWSMYVYMPLAAQHWGMHGAIRYYYDQREIHGAHLVYYGARQVAADWAAPEGDDNGVRDTWTVRTAVPDDVQEGQPVIVRVTLKSVDDRRLEQDLRLAGRIDHVDAGGAAIRFAFPAAEQAKLAPIVTAGRAKTANRATRPPIRLVDGDRLIAWQLYWRGENFWSGDEIWGPLPERQTAFKDTDNVKFLKYINDRELCPEGRRYWVITEAGRVTNLKSILPTARAKESFRIEDMSSNKFTLTSFIL